ncbi:unnamed protein product [Oncorhynchus mykiss]|uniref:Ras-related protein Rab n=1 Tax=Oncorhynchus mykiss TaxID=8022 RepID=A0A060ZBT8_ONCMY|nr:unnamed protein product [Oncorhynchus mykiss]
MSSWSNGEHFWLLTWFKSQQLQQQYISVSVSPVGQERFGNMTRVYYREAMGAFIVFDVTRPTTFEAITKWKEDLDSKLMLTNRESIATVLLANKCDQGREVLTNNGVKMDQFCKDNGFVGWFETSAKVGTQTHAHTYTYAPMCTHTHTHPCAQTHAHTYAPMCTNTCTHTHTRPCAHTHRTHAHTYAPMCTHTQKTCTHIRTHVHKHMHTHTHPCAQTHTENMHTHTHPCAQTHTENMHTHTHPCAQTHAHTYAPMCTHTQKTCTTAIWGGVLIQPPSMGLTPHRVLYTLL